jgi:hypothetical protein
MRPVRIQPALLPGLGEGEAEAVVAVVVVAAVAVRTRRTFHRRSRIRIRAIDGPTRPASTARGVSSRTVSRS